MTRLPFDPERVREPEKPVKGRREKVRYGEFEVGKALTVTQVSQLLKRVISDHSPSPLRVVGEVSNFSDRKHWYLSLKDDQNVISCVMWASAAKKAGFVPKHGQEVVAKGRLDYYGPQGRLQFYIDSLESVGAGALEIQFQKLCGELREAGYFAEERKKRLPDFVRHVAVVTSENGAAVADVIKTARQRYEGIKISVFDVRVQGAGAAPEIAEAVNALSEQHERLGLDAIILTRGGGSLEDLWAFNEREVADAVFGCVLPIVAAIGHETDTTIAELVADLRCSTPTQAAGRLVADASGEEQHLGQLRHRLGLAVKRMCDHARVRLNAVAGHPMFRRPEALVGLQRDRVGGLVMRLGRVMGERLHEGRERLNGIRQLLGGIEPVSRLELGRAKVAHLKERLAAAMSGRLEKGRVMLGAMEKQLGAVSPTRVLERGYTYTTTENGVVLRTVVQAKEEGEIRTHFVDGVLASRVEGKAKATGRKGKKASGRKGKSSGEGDVGTRKKSKPNGAGGKAESIAQPSLFE